MLNPLVKLVKSLVISPCHYKFGGWFRADNIARRLNCRFLYPSKPYNVLLRICRGLYNCLYIFRYKVVYIFELVQPETLFPALLARVLGKRVIVDIADEWLASPTYRRADCLTKWLIKFIDTKLVKLFNEVTVSSDYLKEKYKHTLAVKLINGVNKDEFEPVSRSYARSILGVRLNEKIMLSFGNTCGEMRKYWLDETCECLTLLGQNIQWITDRYFETKGLALWLGACDLVLFPTGDNPCERACFPIRVGTCLNAGRVIATDNSPSEFHNTLKPYNCLVVGETPYELAAQISLFFKDNELRNKLEENTIKARQELDWDKLIINVKEFL